MEASSPVFVGSLLMSFKVFTRKVGMFLRAHTYEQRSKNHSLFPSVSVFLSSLCFCLSFRLVFLSFLCSVSVNFSLAPSKSHSVPSLFPSVSVFPSFFLLFSSNLLYINIFSCFCFSFCLFLSSLQFKSTVY